MIEYQKIPNIYKRDEKTKRLIEGCFSSEELQYLRSADWIFTEKVDGTNIRVHWDGHSVTFGGRTDRANIPAHLANKLNELFSGPDNEEIFEQTFGNKDVILFGEGYGEKIQSGGAYGPINFILFDVLVEEKHWLRIIDVENIAGTFGIQYVPIVGIGSLDDAVEFIKKHPQSRLKQEPMEGVVCKPLVEMRARNGERVIVKIKCRDWLKQEAKDDNT